MNTIPCNNCGADIEIDKALENQIENRILIQVQKKHEDQINEIKTKAAKNANEQFKQQLDLQRIKNTQILNFEREKIKTEQEGVTKKREQEQELLIQTLRDDAVAEKEASAKLREQLKEILNELRNERKARVEAELEAQKKLAANEDNIRQEATKNANEVHRLKQLEMEKKLADTQKALETAQRKAAQGSQQNQGEVLELDLESNLRNVFPFDEFVDVKNGQRGADLKQSVKNENLLTCGLILWETKNGKWQPAWIKKFKEDIRNANANIGVIVSHQMPTDFNDIKHLEANVWVVKPHLAPIIASALRTTILQVDAAYRNNQGKDTKIEALYQFLVGPEFRHRVEAIVENYSMLQSELEKEKRTTQLRWSRQEQSIRAVVDNTIGMYGDLQGITNRGLPIIKAIEVNEEQEDDEAATILVKA
jgi:hypothetical protein